MTRAEVVAEARSWELTPYHHRARLKGIGVDCAQLPIAVYAACGLFPPFDPAYPADWMLHRGEELFLTAVLERGREIGRDELGPGDLALWRYGRCFSHAGIVIEPPVVLHAVLRAGAVVRGDMDRDQELASRPVRFFTLF